MCGRFTSVFNADQIKQVYGIDAAAEIEPSYNITPGSSVSLIRNNPISGRRELTVMEWGFIPPWVQGGAGGPRLINARAESITLKPAFREAFRERRAIIPAGGFYEWKKIGQLRQPFYITRRDGCPFSLAGLWSQRVREGKLVETFVIVTTRPNDLIASIHDRMPVIVAKNHLVRWLERYTSPAFLSALLAPFPAEQMIAYPVSRLVNNPRHDGPHLLQRVEE